MAIGMDVDALRDGEGASYAHAAWLHQTRSVAGQRKDSG
jgi:hypothetical protein